DWVDMSSPTELEQFQQPQPLPVYDAAIRWLAEYHHPQQRRQLLHSHQQKLNQFIQDSNAQWDSGKYTINRYSQSRALESLFATSEIQENIQASKSEDGGNVPLHRNGVSDDKLSMNELQLHLSNQAATLRMNMTSEYEDMRIFQNSELETMLKAKVNKEPEFSKLVDEARIHGIRPQPHRPHPLRPTSRTATTSSTNPSPVTQQILSPVISHSPSDFPDLTSLGNDPSLSPFIKFFLHLQVVQHNWLAISRNWAQYVVIFQRDLMTEIAFAKAILQDAVRTNNTTKFTVEPEHIQRTREALKNIPESMHMTHVITEAILGMAEAGDIELTDAANDSTGETFGP